MKNSRKLFLAAGAMFFSGSAAAADWTVNVVPAFDFAIKNSSFTLEDGTPADYLAKPTYTTFMPSLAVSVGPIYGVVSYETPLAPWQDTQLEMGGGSDIYKQISFDRHETVFTLGYRLPFSVNVFAGYIHGQSRQTEAWYLTYWDGANWSHRIWPTTYVFDEKGFFVGASYSHTFGEKGTLSVSAAVGVMDGKYTMLDYNGTADPSTWVSSKTEYISQAPGSSLSLGWSGPMNGNMVYRVGMKVTKYIFDNSSVTTTTGGGTITLPDTSRIDESITSFSMGIANYF